MDNKYSKDTTYTYLAHAKFNWNWDQHKYKSKEWVNGAWKYIYNTTNKAKNTIFNTAQNVAKNTVNTAKNVSSAVSNTATNAAKNVYKVASNTAQNATKAATDTVNKAKEEIKEKVSDTKTVARNVVDKVDKEKVELTKTAKEAIKKAPLPKAVQAKLDIINKTPLSSAIKGYVTEEYTTVHDLDTRDKLKLNNTKNEDIDQITITDEIRYWQGELHESWEGGDYALDVLDGLFNGDWDGAFDIAAAALYLTGTILPLMGVIDIMSIAENNYIKKRNKELREKAREEEFNRRQKEEIPKILDQMAKQKKNILETVVDYTTSDLWADIKDRFQKSNSTINQLKHAISDTTETKSLNLSEKERDKIMESINTKYDPWDNDDGWEYNCYSCTLAYDLNNRGIECEAIPDLDGEDMDIIEKFYKDPKIVNFDGYEKLDDHYWGYSESEAKDIIETVSEIYPEGAYGQCMVMWAPPGYSGGHSMVFEIQNGEMIIRDCQSGTIYKSDDLEYIIENSGYIEVYRTDNLELNDNYKKYVKEK